MADGEMDIKALKQRVDKLEQRLLLEDHHSGNISTFEADHLNIGGYFNLTGTSWNLPHGKNQQNFDEIEFGLIIRGQINPSISFFGHIEFEQELQIINEHAPYREFQDVETQVDPEDIFITYDANDDFSLSMGALITPFGVSNREHFDFLRWQNEKPLALRENSGDFIFFDDHVLGVSANYNLNLESGIIESSLYAGSINVGASRFVSGYRIGHRSESGRYKFGTSLQTGQRNAHDRYYTFGLDAKIEVGAFGLRSEAMITELRVGQYNQDRNPISFYLEPWFHLVQNRHILYGRVDYLHDTIGLHKVDHDRDTSTATIADPVELYEVTLGYNYLPWPYWRLSFGVTQTHYVGKNSQLNGEDRDFTALEWGTVLSF